MPARKSGAPTLIGVDIGSTNIKAALVGPGSGVLHVARRATETHAVRGGGAYHKPAELLGAVESAIVECVAAAAHAHLAAPSGIGITSMAESGVPVDRRDLPIGDIIAWHDSRSERQAAWLERQIGAQALFARTGLRPEPKYSLPKLLWIREQRAADFTRLRHWAGVAELVGLSLTGKLATNASLACRTMAFDVSSRKWDRELLALASLEPENMPEVLPLGRAAGGLTEVAAKRLGLPVGTPVAIAGHDHLAAALGAGVTKPGDALDSMGSAEATLLVTAEPALADDVRRGGFSTGCHAIDDLSYVAGGLQSSGAMVEWFVDAFLPTPPARRGVVADRYARFTELLELAAPGPAEPIVRPYLRGRTAPHRDPTASLEFEGLRETHRLPDLAAALVDGAAYHVRWMLDELARITAVRLDLVKVTGGGSRNRRWVTAKAALGPGKLEIVRTEEAAALGAALVAGVAGGVYASVADALLDASPFDRATAPASIRAKYDAAYLDRWLPAVITRLRQSGMP
jgi:xylulokinase